MTTLAKSIEFNIGQKILLEPVNIGQGIDGWSITINGITIITKYDDAYFLGKNGEKFSCKFLYDAINNGEDPYSYCKKCRDYEHDTCSYTPECPCCEKTMSLLQI